MKTKLTDKQKGIYQRIITETVSGAMLQNYDYLKSIIAAVVEYRHGHKAVKEVFANVENKDRNSYLKVGKLMARYMLPNAGYILRSWQNIGFFIAQDYLFAYKEQFENLPKDFQEAKEFGELISDDEMQKIINNFNERMMSL